MSCVLRKNKGSGYVKPSGSNDIDQALQALKGAREALDAKMFPQTYNQIDKVIQRTDPPDCSNSLVSTSIKR